MDRTLLCPSVCVHTTLLRTIAGVCYPSAGRIFLGGADITDVPAAHRDIGVVFQNYALFPHLSVAENLGFGLKARRRPKDEMARQIERMLSLVKLDGFAERYTQQLRGGPKKRADRKRAGKGKRGAVRVDLGGRRNLKKQTASIRQVNKS